MEIQERAFSGKIFRPQPRSFLSSNKKRLVVLTPWGQEVTSPKEVFESMETQYSRLSGDLESTHVFQKMQSLTVIENNLRTTILQTNQDIFNHINQEEYVMGFELLFLAIEGNLLSWAQIGQPFLLLDKPNWPLLVAGQVMDMSFNAFNIKGILPPLPDKLMGVHYDIPFTPFCVRIHPKDRLILLSRSAIPPAWFKTKREQNTLESLSQLAAKDNPSLPFWMAIVTL